MLRHVVLPTIFEDHSSFWMKFQIGTRAGFEHIRTGIDHILFLFSLLLTATSKPIQGKWVSNRSWKESIIYVLKVASAFTLGHFLTLTLSALGYVNLPEKPVEILIAFSILVTAIHAIKPLPIRFFLFIPFIFGLVHGLAFAKLLTHLLLFYTDLSLSLFTFNLGIELCQILIIVTSLPLIFAIGKSRYFGYWRISTAVLILVTAQFWIGQRAFSLKNPIEPFLQFITNNLFYLFGFAIIGASITYVLDRSKKRKVITNI